MTATERVRELLDERGVEWAEGIARPELTQVRIDGKVVKFHPWQPNTLKVSLFDITPDQAVAATLGRGMLTADDVRDLIERHSDASGGNGRDFHNGAYVAIADELNATLGSFNCSNDCTNGERMDVPRLPHFWTHDGVLHIEATRMPTRIVVCEGGTCEFVPKRELDASEAENAKLRELAAKMARALGINSEWCDRDCEREFGCYCEPCPLDQALRELGVEVDA